MQITKIYIQVNTLSNKFVVIDYTPQPGSDLIQILDHLRMYLHGTCTVFANVPDIQRAVISQLDSRVKMTTLLPGTAGDLRDLLEKCVAMSIGSDFVILFVGRADFMRIVPYVAGRLGVSDSEMSLPQGTVIARIEAGKEPILLEAGKLDLVDIANEAE